MILGVGGTIDIRKTFSEIFWKFLDKQVSKSSAACQKTYVCQVRFIECLPFLATQTEQLSAEFVPKFRFDLHVWVEFFPSAVERQIERVTRLK